MSQPAANVDPYPSRVEAQPRVSPRQDPVVWSASRDGAPLSETEIAHYEENGYLILPEVFDGNELDQLLAAADVALARHGIDAATIIEEPDSHAVRSIFEIHRQNEQLGAVARDPRLADIARYLLGEPVYIHQSRLNYKPGFEGKDFWWHSDFETWHIEDGMPRMRALSMSIMLTDNLVCNGPLLLVNGSHKHYVACVGETPAEHYKASLKKQEYGVPDHDSIARLSTRGIRAALARAGSVVIFDCNILHGSGSNISPYPRSNLFFVYNALSNRCVAPFSGQPPRPQHIANRAHVEPV
ncbi:MAG: ectoine hydroxylase [Gammaproteobacteria bacterium]